MSEIWIVVKREFLERVRTKSFLFGTLFFPLFFIGIYSIPFLVGQESRERRLALVDEAPPGVADRFVEVLTTVPPGADADERDTYRIERVEGRLADLRASLTQRVQSEEIDGYVAFPADVVESNSVVFAARNVGNIGVLERIDDAATSAVRTERLRRAGLEGAQLAALTRGVQLQTTRITATGETGGNAFAPLIYAYVVALLTYFLVFFYGVSVMRSVLEEKSNRIAEVIVSSMRASHLLTGKIIGVGGVALLQVGIWALFIIAAITQLDVLAERFDIPPDLFTSVHLNPGVGLALVGFFVLGYLAYAAIFAAMGAAVNTEQEAQSLQMFVVLPLILPMLMTMQISNEPLGRIATVLGLFPLTSSIAMPMRMGVAEVPPLQIVAALLLLVLTLVGVAWLAGKIYRVGILSTGQKPTLKELGRWLRAA